MSRALILALCLAASSAANAGDDWNGPDKVGHMEWSALYGAIASAYVNEPGGWNWKAAGLCMVPGVAKEFKDSWAKEGSGFSYKDVAADFAGCAIGISVTQQTVVRFMHRKDETKIVVTWTY